MNELTTLKTIIAEKEEAYERAYTSTDSQRLAKQIQDLKQINITLERLERNKGKQKGLF